MSSCHHGDGHASALILEPECECSAFQGRSERQCVDTQWVDLLTPDFKTTPPIVTSHVNANSSHRLILTCMMDSLTKVTGIPPFLGLHGAYCLKNDTASLPNVQPSDTYTQGQQAIADLHVLGVTTKVQTLNQLYTNHNHTRIQRAHKQTHKTHTLSSLSLMN